MQTVAQELQPEFFEALIKSRNKEKIHNILLEKGFLKHPDRNLENGNYYLINKENTVIEISENHIGTSISLSLMPKEQFYDFEGYFKSSYEQFDDERGCKECWMTYYKKNNTDIEFRFYYPYWAQDEELRTTLHYYIYAWNWK